MSLNKVILIGNVGRDPDVRYFEGGSAIANFTVATNERGYRLSNGTEVPERTDWHNIVVRGDRVQFVERHVRKGSSVLIDGRLRYREYEKEGVRRFITEIIADRIDFYSTAPRRDNNGEFQNNNQQNNNNQQPAVQAQPQAAVQQPAAEGQENVETPSDDLPF